MSSNPLNQKSVMHLAPGHWAGHMRIYHRQCMTLVKSGYSVDLMAHGRSGEELDPRIRFHSLGTYGTPSLSWRLFDRYFRSQKAYSLALGSKSGLYHFHSPEFISWGVRLRARTGCPVIFDCMEDFEGYALQRRGVPTLLRRPLSQIVKRQLEYGAKKFDAVIVSDAGTGRLFEPYAQRVILIHNFPQVTLFNVDGLRVPEKPYDIVYHGSMPKYHLQALLRIDEVLVARGYKVRWRLIGQIPEKTWFNSELSRKGISERVFMSGLIPHDSIASELIKAKMGIIPLPNLPKFQNNIPQKLFEFMAVGMPVVLSDLPPSRPFVDQGASAFMVPPDDYEDYAGAIIKLLNDTNLRRRMGEMGRKKFLQDYNWEKESKKLLNLYEELLPT